MAFKTTSRAGWIDRARAADIGSVARDRGLELKRSGKELIGPCPKCAGNDRFSINTFKGCFNCRGCGAKGDVIDLVQFLDDRGFNEACERLTGEAPPGVNGTGGTDSKAAELEKLAKKLAQNRAEAAERDRRDCERQREKARRLWRRSAPISGTIGERYLREARGYRGLLPSTLRFLPARNGYAPAVIAAFGLTSEIRPGVLAPIAEPLGVHLIKLQPDGTDRIRDEALKPKITIGRGFTAPIVLAAPSHWVSLIVAEGVEDALTAHDLIGGAAWAAASAGRMPGLATVVPAYVDSVMVLVDDNDAGRVNSDKLAARLRKRGVDEVLMAMCQP